MNEPSGLDPALADLVEELSNQLLAREAVDVSAYLRAHPEHAEELRRLLPSLQALADVGRSAAEGDAALAPAPPQVGRVLGDFRLLREVGRGGMGVVYEAVQESLGRPVALKVLPADARLGPQQRERFQREARAAARLHHTNIVPIYGVGEDQGTHYYAMQFIHGLGLDVVLRGLRPPQPGTASPETNRLLHGLRSGRFDEAAPDATDADRTETTPASGKRSGAGGDSEAEYFRGVARVGVQVASALDYAHRQGVLHRDVKPSNLLLGPDGTVWVADFGLAKVEGAAELTGTGDVVGTLRYLAPERFRGVSDPRGDVYSLGLTLYELATLRPAFRENDRLRLLDQIHKEAPLPPRQVAPGVPRDLESIILKASDKEPARRYQTAEELAEDLRCFLAGEPIRARRLGLLERLGRWCRRHPAQAAAVGTGLAALVALAVAVVLALQARDVALGLAQAQAALAEQKGVLAETERAARRQAEREAAHFLFEQALTHCTQEDGARGLLWLARSLGKAVEADCPDLEETIRLQLAGWRRHLHPLRGVFAQGDGYIIVAFGPEGRTLVTAGGNTVQVWDARSGAPLGPPLLCTDTVKAVAFSPDGKVLLTGCADGMARLWDAATGKVVGPPLLHGGRVHAVAFSPDGKTVLTGSYDHTARLWDAATGEMRRPPLNHAGGVLAAAFSPRGDRVVTGTNAGVARLWDVATGLPVGVPIRHPPMIFALAFSPDGKTLLTGSSDNTARLWDVTTGQPRSPPLPHHHFVTAVTFSPDGQTVLSGSSDRTARLWDANTGRPVGPPLAHAEGVYSVAFHPDGKAVLTGGGDGTARLWDIETGYRASWNSSQKDIEAAAFDADGGGLLTGGRDGTVRSGDAATGQERRPSWQPQPQGYVLAFGPGGKAVLTATLPGSDTPAQVRAWDTATHEPLGPPLPHPDWVDAAIFSPDGKAVLTGCRDHFARLWDLTAGRELLPPRPHPKAVLTVAFSPDGKTAVTGGVEGTVRRWDVSTGQPAGPALSHRRAVRALAFRPDGAVLLTGGLDSVAARWQVATGAAAGPPLLHPGEVQAVAFSPDGRWLLTGSPDGSARLWDAATGKIVGPPLEQHGAILVVTFSPDGRTFLTAGKDTPVRLWDVPAPAAGSPERILRWAQALTGMELQDDGVIRVEDARTWQLRRQQLAALGGPPAP